MPNNLDRPLVLLVDDSPTQREMLHSVLATSGYRVVEAVDGSDALSKLAEQPVHAIVADGEMPVIDGYQLCRLIKGDPTTAHLPYVLLTVAPQGFRRLRAETCGADLFAPKANAIDVARLPGHLQTLIQSASEQGRPTTGRRRRGDLNGWLGRLAQTVEQSLLESTLRRRVAALYDGSHDVFKVSTGFIELVEDLVLPGAIAVAFPHLDGWQVTARCGEETSATMRQAVRAVLVDRRIVAADDEIEWSEVDCTLHFEPDGIVKAFPVGIGSEGEDGLVVIGAAASVIDRYALLLRAALDELGRVFHIERAHLEIYRAAVRDALTGAWNRRYIMELLERELARVRRYGGDLTAIMVDIDHFKRVNDVYGHIAGDEVLQGVAQRIRGVIRNSDSLARLGGEEFLVLCPHTSAAQGAILAERLRAAIADRPFGGLDERVTISLGVAQARSSDASAQAFIGRADDQLYRAKESGRNRSCVAL